MSGGSQIRVPATLNWTSCQAVLIRGQLTVVMTAPTSTSDVRTETVDAAAAAQFARATGLRRLSKTARLTSESEPGTLVVTSAGTTARTDQAAVAAISSSIGQSPALPETLDVAIVFGGPHVGRTALQRLKSASERGLAVGMSARVIDLRPSTPRIDDVGTFIADGAREIEWPAPGDRVLLDQNILVSLDGCLKSGDKRLCEHLRDLFGWLAVCDPIPGFAFAECLTATGSAALANRLQAAYAVFMRHAHETLTLNELRAAAAAYTPPAHERLDAGANMDVLTDMNYLGILHALRVWRSIPTEGFVAKHRLAAWSDWLRSVNVEHAGVSAYCRVTVRLLLLSENNGPRDSPGNLAVRLLKFRSSPTRASLRGAAWDLAYLLFADLARSGETDLEGSGRVLVLTADKPLQDLARAGFLAGSLHAPGGPTGLVMHRRQESTKFSAKQLSAIEELEGAVAADQYARVASSWRTLNQLQLRGDIAGLEIELDLK